MFSALQRTTASTFTAIIKLGQSETPHTPFERIQAQEQLAAALTVEQIDEAITRLMEIRCTMHGLEESDTDPNILAWESREAAFSGLQTT